MPSPSPDQTSSRAPSSGSPYIDEDVVFGKRDSLVVDFDAHPPGKAVDGREMKKPYHSASFDFRLAPSPA